MIMLSIIAFILSLIGIPVFISLRRINLATKRAMLTHKMVALTLKWQDVNDWGTPSQKAQGMQEFTSALEEEITKQLHPYRKLI